MLFIKEFRSLYWQLFRKNQSKSGGRMKSTKKPAKSTKGKQKGISPRKKENKKLSLLFSK
jgi:hypothetical protein